MTWLLTDTETRYSLTLAAMRYNAEHPQGLCTGHEMTFDRDENSVQPHPSNSEVQHEVPTKKATRYSDNENKHGHAFVQTLIHAGCTGPEVEATYEREYHGARSIRALLFHFRLTNLKSEVAKNKGTK